MHELSKLITGSMKKLYPRKTMANVVLQALKFCVRNLVLFVGLRPKISFINFMNSQFALTRSNNNITVTVTVNSMVMEEQWLFVCTTVCTVCTVCILVLGAHVCSLVLDSGLWTLNLRLLHSKQTRELQWPVSLSALDAAMTLRSLRSPAMVLRGRFRGSSKSHLQDLVGS